MKKTLFGLSAAVMLLSFASCKKDYNCTCEFKFNNAPKQSTSYAINNASRGDAHDACDASETNLKSVAGNTDVECELND
jgi:hypothetical protein